MYNKSKRVLRKIVEKICEEFIDDQNFQMV